MCVDVSQCMSMYFNLRQMYVGVRQCTHPMASSVSDEASVQRFYVAVVANLCGMALVCSEARLCDMGRSETVGKYTNMI